MFIVAIACQPLAMENMLQDGSHGNGYRATERYLPRKFMRKVFLMRVTSD